MVCQARPAQGKTILIIVAILQQLKTDTKAIVMCASKKSAIKMGEVFLHIGTHMDITISVLGDRKGNKAQIIIGTPEYFCENIPLSDNIRHIVLDEVEQLPINSINKALAYIATMRVSCQILVLGQQITPKQQNNFLHLMQDALEFYEDACLINQEKTASRSSNRYQWHEYEKYLTKVSTSLITVIEEE